MNATQMLVLVARRKKSYQQRVKALFGSSIVAYYTMDEQSGTLAKDTSGHGYNGTYAGVTLGTAQSKFLKPSPTFDGTADYVNIFSAGLAGAWNFDEFSILTWVKPTPASWIDGAFHDPIMLWTGGGYVMFQKSSANNRFSAVRFNGANTNVTIDNLDFSVWTPLLLTGSLSNNRMILYSNGVELGRTLLGTTWGIGAMDAAKIGAYDTTLQSWFGSLSDVILFNRELTLVEAHTLAAGIPRLSVIGDSIAAFSTLTWPGKVQKQYQSGSCGLNDKAVGGHSIMANMDAQVAACATDDADIIIMALGVNDNNAGDMAALQAKVESNITALRLSNPRAKLYYFNVLPVWINNTVGAAVDKSNIKTAIAAACTAKGVTCWDSFTTPWILQSDTSDGTHPTAGGVTKIVAQIMARI